MGFCFSVWIYPGDGPESPAQRTRSHRPPVFRCRMTFCGAALLSVRRYTGDGLESPVPPESPAHRTRNLRSLVLAAFLAKCGAPLDRGPELHQSMSGVSGPSGLESPIYPDDPTCGAPLVPCPEGGRSLAGISGPGRSLRCTYTGVSGLSRLQRLVFCGDL